FTNVALLFSNIVTAFTYNPSALSTVANFDPGTFSCEVCGAQFETRRGLSSHARSHLRQLGIRASESSGAPIHFLYQIAKERNLDSQIRRLHEPTSAKNCSPSTPQRDEVIEVMDVDKQPVPLSILAKAAKAALPSTSCSTPSPGDSPVLVPSSSPSSVVRKAPISSLLPVSSPLRSLEHKAGGMKSLTSSLSTFTTSKPMWAPQDHDAPLNLTLEADPSKDIVCQLCGAWFETRKGLSSHARAHLRHFGVEYSESKGSPIDVLTQLIESDEFKHKARELQLDGPPETRCLSSALSSPKPHLFTLPVSSSPLLYKVTTSKTTSASTLLGPPAKRHKPSTMQIFRLSSGEIMSLPLSKSLLFLPGEPLKEIGCEFCGEYFENRKGLSSHARSHLRQMGITQWSVNGSPIDTLREIIARRGLPSALPLKPPRNPAPPSPAPPLQLELTHPGTAAPSGGYSSRGLSPTMTGSNSVHPLNLAISHDMEPSRDIRCEFCGEYFENRKGLSSHARSHLRQMGITQWSVNGSPIDTLREVMRKRGVTSAAELEPEIKKESGVESCSPSWERVRADPSCELCGFYFENRKALASHARAHLRQFGVTEWSVNGSPIETLSAWIRSRPQKVLDMHRSYMQGNSLSSSLKKVRSVYSKKNFSYPSHCSPSLQPPRLSGSLTLQAQVARSELNVRLPRGFERRPLKHPSCPDGAERDSCSPRPPRTGTGTGTVPALVPKPPSYPLVKLEGNFYTLKCRFCEVEFHGPLSVQEDWIRHLQQHIFKMNYKSVSPLSEPQAPLKQLFQTVT
uniref:Si:ch211-194b1.1 n=1 Tax=Neogobius melanostomus TaxID=47308 RepID=A0A8C6TS34_9GOBI